MERRFVTYITPKKLTDIHNRGRPTLKDVRQFWNGLVRGFIERITFFTSEIKE